MDTKKELDWLAEDFQSFQKVLTAIGDETRQHLLLIMMKSNRCDGMRVQEIAEKNESFQARGIPSYPDIKGRRFIEDEKRRGEDLLLLRPRSRYP